MEGEDEVGEELKWSLAPSVQYVTAAFDGYAYFYDKSMRVLGYRAAEMLISAVTAVLDSDSDIDVENSSHAHAKLWDLGCGTGIAGSDLAAAHAAGTWPTHWGPGERTCIEVSGRMLAEARSKGNYDKYVQGEVMEQLRLARGAAVDLVIAADLAPYMGSLQGLLQGVAGVLKRGGRFALTIEALEPHLPLPEALAQLQRASAVGAAADDDEFRGRGWELMPSGRLAHDRWHVERAALAAGFEIDAVGDGPIRWQEAQPVEGHVFVLRLPLISE